LDQQRLHRPMKSGFHVPSNDAWQNHSVAQSEGTLFAQLQNLFCRKTS
jgi:hypothetical protein